MIPVIFNLFNYFNCSKFNLFDNHDYWQKRSLGSLIFYLHHLEFDYPGQEEEFIPPEMFTEMFLCVNFYIP